MNHPIIERELLSILRSRKALAMQVIPAVVFAFLVILRWPTDSQVGLSGSQSQEVFRLFGCGLLATIMLLVPIFPATTLVTEKRQGTMALLLNTPMSNWSIYFGKLLGILGFALLPLVMSLPAAAACYAMGGISLTGNLLALYFVLLLATLQYVTLGLYVGSYANTTDGALRITYGLVVLMTGVAMIPYQFLQGTSESWRVTAAEWLRCISPIPALMELLGYGDVGGQGLITSGHLAARYMMLAAVMIVLVALHTIYRLKQTMFDRSRAQGVITDDRSIGMRSFRRLFYLIDPQRRKSTIGPFTNPVMVKEFRTRRLGRSHWMLRLIAGCALASLGMAYATTMGTIDWGVETIGGLMVILQVALIVLLTPSLAAGIISAEHENGGWALLLMTPLSPGQILRGKLISVLWPLLLVLLATLPGYAVMIWIEPVLTQQICYVLVCLVLCSLFSLMLSGMVSSFFRHTAPATITAYALLVAIYGGTMLFWLGRDAPFGQSTVQAALLLNPMAAAMSILKVPGFEQYELVPLNWWITIVATVLCAIVLRVRIQRLMSPQ